MKNCASCDKGFKAAPVICARCGQVLCQTCAIEHDCPKKKS